MEQVNVRIHLKTSQAQVHRDSTTTKRFKLASWVMDSLYASTRTLLRKTRLLGSNPTGVATLNLTGDATTLLSISIQSDKPCLPWDLTSQSGVLLTVRAPQDGAQRRLPMDLIAVLDVSGSMSGPKIDLLRETLLSAVRGVQ